MNIFYNDLTRVEELDTKYPGADWFAILLDGGRAAVEEYAEFMEERNQ